MSMANIRRHIAFMTFWEAMEAIPLTGKPTVRQVLPAVNAFMRLPGNEVGGNLHIVLYQPNFDDASVQFCRIWADVVGDSAGVALAQVLLRMSRTQRSKLNALRSYAREAPE